MTKHKNIFILSLCLFTLNLGCDLNCTSKKTQPCPGPCPITRPGSKKQGSLPNQLLPTDPTSATGKPAPNEQTRPVIPQVVPQTASKPKIEWLNSEILLIELNGVDLNGYKVSLAYTYTLGEYDHGVPNRFPVVELELNYSEGKDAPLKYVTISDQGADNRAEEVSIEVRIGPSLVEPFLYRRGQTKTEKIFTQTDALLVRFRKELEVDRLVKTGPINKPDINPFPKKK